MHNLVLFVIVLLNFKLLDLFSVNLLPYHHEAVGSSPGNSLLQKCSEKLCT
jgi:hypothetical protein